MKRRTGTAAKAVTRPLLRVPDAARLLCITARALYGWLSLGTVLPAEAVVRIGAGRIYLKRQVLVDWLRGKTSGAAPP